MLASVAGEVAVVAVDHRQARAPWGAKTRSRGVQELDRHAAASSYSWMTPVGCINTILLQITPFQDVTELMHPTRRPPPTRPRTPCLIQHYNRGRPHRALDLKPPDPKALAPTATDSPPRALQVNRRDLLGGLIHEYELAAA